MVPLRPSRTGLKISRQRADADPTSSRPPLNAIS